MTFALFRNDEFFYPLILGCCSIRVIFFIFFKIKLSMFFEYYPLNQFKL